MKGLFIFAKEPIPALVPIMRPIQWVPGSLSPGVKLLEFEADHSHLVPRLSIHGGISPLPIRLHGVVLS
jgi:hypothetical protein